MSPQDARTDLGTFGYQPALDGLRAFAVVLVLLYHQGFSWMTGGYVGVSVFFTLSGYLITSLLVVEHRAKGRVAFGAFYRRRLKRLMPASLLCLIGIAVLSAAGYYEHAAGLRADVVSSALQVANWRALTRGLTYAQLIQGGASPVDHFWSLSVEEQFYWVWPLAFASLAFLARRRSLVVSVTALAGVAVLAAPLIAHHWGPDVAYWSTPARLGEILVGAALAVWLDRWRRRPSWWALLTWPALALVLWAAIALPSDHGLAYRGGFGAGALVTVALIAGLQVRGPLQALLSTGPFVGLGRISYGVYLYHWPIYVLLDQDRVGLDSVALFAVRAAATLAVAVFSYFLVERPIRTSDVSMAKVLVAASAATATAVVVALVLVQSDANSFAGGGESSRVSIAPTTGPLPTLAPASSMAPTTSSAIPGSTVLPSVSRPVRILIIGDSTAEALSAGVISWAADHPELAQVDSLAAPGCGLITAAGMEGDDGTFGGICRNVRQKLLPKALRERTPDLVLILVTLPDVLDRSWTTAEGYLHATDPRYVAHLRTDYAATADQLLAVPNLRIAWLIAARPSSKCVCGRPYTPEMFLGQNQEIDALVAAHPDRISKVDFAGWLTSAEAGDDSYRTDGLHLNDAGARRIMDEHLADALLRIALGIF